MSRLILPSRKMWTPPQRQSGFVVLDAYRGEVGGSWNTAVTTSHGSDSAGWGGYTLRVKIPMGDLISGSKLRLTLRGASSGTALAVKNAYIGNQASSGDVYDFATTPFRVKVAGYDYFSVPVSGTVLTDEIVFSVGGTNLVFSAEFTAGDMSVASRTDWEKYEKSGYDAATVDASGYVGYPPSNAFLISKIEVWQP